MITFFCKSTIFIRILQVLSGRNCMRKLLGIQYSVLILILMADCRKMDMILLLPILFHNFVNTCFDIEVK